MKILIVSDSHGRCYHLDRAVRRVKPIDMLIHLGDLEGDEDYIRGIADCPVEMISGNNDFFSHTEAEKEISIGKYRAFLCHGHMYGVSLGTENIKEEARSRKVNVVMFGHTHKPYLEYCSDGLVVLNPGSLSYPRQDGRHPSFMIMEIDRFGEAHYTTNFL